MAAYPTIFDLLKDDGTTQPWKRMNTLASLPLQYMTSLIIIVKGPNHHIQVLWGIEKLPFSYANETALDVHTVAFSRDIIAGDTPHIIAISINW